MVYIFLDHCTDTCYNIIFGVNDTYIHTYIFIYCPLLYYCTVHGYMHAGVLKSLCCTVEDVFCHVLLRGFLLV